MDLIILDKKQVEKKQWFLCKGNMLEYISTLKRDFSEFQIQRRIVRNGYLDGILKTVTDGEPMPTITLTCPQAIAIKNDSIEISPENIEILDGLQRSFRLWVFWKLADIVTKEHIIDYKVLADKLKKPDMEYIKRLDFVNATYLKSVLDVRYREIVLKSYSEYDLIFVVWTGLTDKEVVEKMLVLNAGQRPVSSTHQFEILFLHYFDKEKLDYDKNIRLLREKEPDYYKMKHGDRKVGQYALSSIIIAIQSFLQAKPLRIASANKVVFEEDSVADARNYREFFTGENLSRFINLVYKLDESWSYMSQDYRLWYGKDTTLSGLFAAFGAYIEDEERSVEGLEKVINRIVSKKADFEIDGYNKAYSDLSSVHVNVGQRVREAIYKYTKALLTGNRISWSKAFNRNDDDYGYTTVPLF